MVSGGIGPNFGGKVALTPLLRPSFLPLCRCYYSRIPHISGLTVPETDLPFHKLCRFCHRFTHPLHIYLYLFRLPHSFRNGFTQPPLPGPWLETLPPLVLGANWTVFRGGTAGAALLRWPGAGASVRGARARAPRRRAARGVSASPDVSGARSAVGSPECGELL